MTKTSKIDEATLLAFLDGELDQVRAAEVEAALEHDAELAEHLARHQALGQTLTAAFAPILDAPVPERLRAAARRPAEVADLAAFRNLKPPPKTRVFWREPQALGLIAASLLGLAVIGQTFLAPGPAPFVTRGGEIVASGALAKALNRQLAANGPKGAIRVALTFRDHEGEICRTFAETAATGVACHQGGAWVVKAIFGGQAGAASAGYRMASGGDPRLMQMVGDLMAGEAFDATEEQAAKAQDWRASAPATTSPP